MNIHIPPAALEAGARAMYADWIQGCLDEDDTARATDYPTWDALDAAEQTHYLSQARAAFEAIVEAWPGMHMEDESAPWVPRLILPLAAPSGAITENPDDKA